MQLMQSQLEELAMAVDMIRQPLQDFAESLTDEQKARFAAVPAAVADRAQQAAAVPTAPAPRLRSGVRPTRSSDRCNRPMRNARPSTI
jgi:hypothetical protein